MRIPRTLQAGLLIAAAVVLGLLAVQGTYALWNASTSTAPGAVSSASFDVSLTGSPSGNVTNMTVPGGAATINLTQSATLAPGTAAYASVAAGNNTNAGGTFSTTITAENPGLLPAGSGTLSQYVKVNGKFASTAATCGTTGYTEISTVAPLTSAAVPKGTGTVLCLQVTLDPATPPAMKGKAVNISLTLTARQLCGVPGGC
jgi:predicted ribosomally synthesized peptide with SipW-like signal peptide